MKVQRLQRKLLEPLRKIKGTSPGGYISCDNDTKTGNDSVCWKPNFRIAEMPILRQKVTADKAGKRGNAENNAYICILTYTRTCVTPGQGRHSG